MLCLAAAAVIAGCAAPRNELLVADMMSGRFDSAYAAARRGEIADASERSYLLAQDTIVVTALAAGKHCEAQPAAEAVYDALRTAGVNADSTVGSFLLSENAARVYKGEPFEQALMYHSIALGDALRGDWGNTRAGSTNALFLLKDFSKNLRHSGGDPLAQRRELIAQAQRADAGPGQPDQLPLVYTPAQSDFEVGYAMKLVAARALGLGPEVQEVRGQLAALDPARLGALADELAGGDYNLILVVDFGVGPSKEQGGPDGAIAYYRPRCASGSEPLEVTLAGSTRTFVPVTDVNRLAHDTKWANLEDLRQAKSTIGNALLIGGAGTAIASRDQTAQIAGLGAAALGLLMKSTSGADTRHVEVFPQRIYVVPLRVEQPGDATIRVPGRSPSVRLTLTPPEPGGLSVGYVRLGASEHWPGGEPLRGRGR